MSNTIPDSEYYEQFGPRDCTKQPVKPVGVRFRINARYCYSPIESVATFATKEEARAELKRWKKEATEQGQHIIGRIVEDD